MDWRGKLIDEKHTWMILDCEFSESTLNGGGVCITADAKDVVIITSCSDLSNFFKDDDGEDEIQ